MGNAKIFSVMRRRDDLPEMRLPLAVLFILLTALTAAAAARLSTPAAGEEILSPQNLAGILASLPFLPLAVTCYGLLILLWRRLWSLLATPVMFGTMLLFGARFSDAFALTLAILLPAYVFAVSLISRESRRRRLDSLAAAAALSLGLAAAARIGVDFGGFSAFLEAYGEAVPRMIGAWYASLFGGTVMPADAMLKETARELLVMCPAYFGMFVIAFAWVSNALVKRMFTLLGCADSFPEEAEKLPFVHAVLYAASVLLTLMLPSSLLPLPHAMAKSALLVLSLPCAAAGVKAITERLEDRLFYVTREKLLAFLLLFTAFSILGAYPFLLLTSLWGAVGAIREKFGKKKE